LGWLFFYFFEVVPAKVNIRNLAVVEFDFVDEVVFAVSCYFAGVVELYVDDFAGLTV
jgi:hypothetical protein